MALQISRTKAKSSGPIRLAHRASEEITITARSTSEKTLPRHGPLNHSRPVRRPGTGGTRNAYQGASGCCKPVRRNRPSRRLSLNSPPPPSQKGATSSRSGGLCPSFPVPSRIRVQSTCSDMPIATRHAPTRQAAVQRVLSPSRATDC